MTSARITTFTQPRWLAFIMLVLFSLLATSAFAHGVAEDDKLFIEQASVAV